MQKLRSNVKKTNGGGAVNRSRRLSAHANRCPASDEHHCRCVAQSRQEKLNNKTKRNPPGTCRREVVYLNRLLNDLKLFESLGNRSNNSREKKETLGSLLHIVVATPIVRNKNFTFLLNSAPHFSLIERPRSDLKAIRHFN